MMRRWRFASTAESNLRTKQLSDMQFYTSEQWPSNIAADRRSDGRPTLTINRIPQFVRQVTNQQRAMRQAVQVSPMDSQADVNTAEAIQGVIRNIENNSDADIAYSTGCEHQCIIGIGYWRVHTEWSDDDGFQQNIVIREIANPFQVFLDPARVRKDGSDTRFGFILDDVPKDEFIEKYGEDAYTTYNAFQTQGDRSPDWYPEGRCRTAEYFYKEITEEEICELKFPSKDDPSKMEIVTLPSKVLPPEKDRPDTWKVLNRRTVQRATVKWARVTPAQVLEGNEDKTAGRLFPSKYIPIVQVLGDEINVNGERDLRGMVRDAKDPQRMYSFWASSLTEIIALTPRAPYIGVEGQFKGHETKWNNANRKSYAYLEVAPVSISGQQVGLPQRQQFEPAIQAIVQAFQLADNDLKAVMGLYDASLGSYGPEQSGKAILARQRQGEIGNSNYLDNLSRSIRHTGRIILDMMPRVLTPARIMRILGVDNNPKNILIHAGADRKEVETLATQQGIENIYDISVGRYDVVMGSGPSFASRRQEAVNAMLELIKAQPEVAQFIGDLIVKNMDWPDAPEVAARLRRLVPPNILNDAAGPASIPPEVQQQLQQLQQENQELKAGVVVDREKIASQERMKQQELEVRERIASMQTEAMMIQTNARLNAAKTQTMIEAEIERINTTIQTNHERMMAQLDGSHRMAELNSQERQSEADRQHEAELQQQQLEAEPAETT
jgi:hypothetical protein